MSMCISGYANTGRSENKFHDSDLFFFLVLGIELRSSSLTGTAFIR